MKKLQKKCKEKFNNLSVSDVKAKKSFYEQCFIKPDDYDTNPKKYADTPYEQRQKSLDYINQVLEDMQDIVANFALFMLGCIICAGLLIASLYIIIKSYKGAENNEIDEINNAIGEGGIAEENRRWDELDDAEKNNLQQEVVNSKIIGPDTKFNQRKPIFDNAIQNRDLIFVNKNVENPPIGPQYSKFCDISNSPFVLYERVGFNFVDKIIWLR